MLIGTRPLALWSATTNECAASWKAGTKVVWSVMMMARKISDAANIRRPRNLPFTAGLPFPFRGGLLGLFGFCHCSLALARRPHGTEHRIEFSGGLLEYLREDHLQERQ